MFQQVKNFLANLNFSDNTSLYFPYNSLLADYGMGGKDSQVFSVRIVAYKQGDVEIQSNEVTPRPSTPIADFDIIYAPDSINLNHSHEYGGSWVHSLIEGPLGVNTNTGLNLGTVASLLSSTMQVINGDGGNIKSPWNTFGGFDIAKAYTGSKAPSFDLVFNLVTHTNPFTDVVFPATLLAYMSYPKVSGNNKGAEILFEAVREGASTLITTAREVASTLNTSDAKKASNSAIDGLEKVVDSAKSLTQGKWRYMMGDTPPYWTLSCSNGIYSMFNASLRNVDITYYGPWIKADDKSLSQQFFNSIKNIPNNTKGGFDLDKILNVEGVISDVDFTKSLGTNTFKGFPSYATVKLNFESNYSKVFGEEIIAGIASGSKITVKTT